MPKTLIELRANIVQSNCLWLTDEKLTTYPAAEWEMLIADVPFCNRINLRGNLSDAQFSDEGYQALIQGFIDSGKNGIDLPITNVYSILF